MLYFVLLAAAAQPTPAPASILIVNTSFRATPSGPLWHLKIRLYPELSETYRGADMPTLYGRVVFEVGRPGERPRLAPFEKFASHHFGATLYPFAPTFQDLNHDGRLDFTLCCRASTYTSKCHIFSTNPGGEVLLIGGFSLADDSAPTSPPLESTPDGFCVPAPNLDAGRACFRWNPEWSGPETGHFEPLPAGLVPAAQ